MPSPINLFLSAIHQRGRIGGIGKILFGVDDELILFTALSHFIYAMCLVDQESNEIATTFSLPFWAVLITLRLNLVKSSALPRGWANLAKQRADLN
ncbi:hypothetical protein [Magnetococcus sp. PR-3]|uniref:hypothetical protein n=1 Tax=Magnetococcus sp. PR-3 TaxID=3120355 RepID=UPI002FCE4860